MHLKLSSFEKALVSEISILSGISQSVVREVLEFSFLRQIEQYYSSKTLCIPFVGDLHVEYKGDVEKEEGREAILECVMKPNSLLKRVIGEAEDGDIDVIRDLLEQKIKPAVSSIINED